MSLLLIVPALLATVTVAAAPADEAGWPCDTPARSLTAPLSVNDRARGDGWSDDAAIVALAQTVSRRSLDESEAVDQVRQFAAARSGRDDRARLAAAIFATIDGERRTIVNGIRRFNTRQSYLAKRIEEGYAALDATGAGPTPAQRQSIEEQATWDQRIFEDRQRMLPIICRQPGALERRLVALLAVLKS